MESILSKKKLTRGVQQQFELAEERICGLEERSIELSSQRNRKKTNVEKWTDSKRPVWHHQGYHHTCNRSPRREQREKREKNERKKAQNVLNLMKNINLDI